MDWKEFLKKYGIYIAIGLIGLYFLLRRSSSKSASTPVGAGRLGSGLAGGASTTSGVVRQPPTATQPVTNPLRRTGGTSSGPATASAYAGLIFSGIDQFMKLLERISGITSRQARTPPTFPGKPRNTATSKDGLIRIFDASGVETVIASGYYDIPPDFGVPGDYWGTSDSGSTFYGDAFGDSSNPYNPFTGGGGNVSSGGFFDSGLGDLMGVISNRGFNPPTESDYPIIIYEDGGRA
jgi:hypothetical protein